MLIFSCFVIINAFSCAYNNIFIVIYTKTWSYVIDLVFKFAILLEWRPWLTPYCPDLNMLPDSYCRYFLNEIWFKLCIICRFLLREDLLLWLIVWFFISKSRIFHQGHGLLRKKKSPDFTRRANLFELLFSLQIRSTRDKPGGGFRGRSYRPIVFGTFIRCFNFKHLEFKVFIKKRIRLY